MNAVDKPELRLSLPPGWRETAEINEGQPVRVFHPPGDAPGVLRVLTDRIAAGGADAGAVAIKLRETAVRFVRPDDARAYDRVIEDRPGGGLVATAVITAAQDDGREETHYLWLLAEPGEGPFIDAAMAALALPRGADGDEAAAAVAAVADEALRAAELTANKKADAAKADTVCCGSRGGR
jgi:hypothetical protein